MHDTAITIYLKAVFKAVDITTKVAARNIYIYDCKTTEAVNLKGNIIPQLVMIK